MSDVDTDWVANSPYGYGIGYTKEQAIAEMVGHSDRDPDGTVEAHVVEHEGNATMHRNGGIEADEIHTVGSVTIEPDQWTLLRETMLEVMGVRSTVAEQGNFETDV